ESPIASHSEPSPPSGNVGFDDLPDSDDAPPAPDRLVAATAPVPIRLPDAPAPRRRSRLGKGGLRGAGMADGARGRVIGARAWDRRSSDIAPLASTLAAALAPVEVEPECAPDMATHFNGHSAGLRIQPERLRQRRRRAAPRRLTLFVVDCSG